MDLRVVIFGVHSAFLNTNMVKEISRKLARVESGFELHGTWYQNGLPCGKTLARSHSIATLQHTEISNHTFQFLRMRPQISTITETPYYTITEFTNLYAIKQGSYGTVYTATLGHWGRIAFKQFMWTGEQHFDKHRREIEILIRLKHPSIVHLYGIVWNGIDKYRFLGYVMEYIEGGSLHDVIYDHTKSFDFREICVGIEQIACGLQFLHENGIIHRDIKPENILVAANQLKLADFGIAKNLDASTTAGAGTIRYMAPEVLSAGKCSTSSDIYSLIITVWEIFHRRTPYYELQEATVFTLSHKIIAGKRPEIDPHKMSSDMATLVIRCWDTEAENRPGIKEVINFFQRNGTLRNQLAAPPVFSLLNLHLSSPKESSTILIIGGQNGEHYTCNMAVLNINRSKWTKLYLELPRDPIPWEGCDQCAVYLNEEIYLFGCLKTDKALFKFNRISLQWIRCADMNVGRTRIVNSCLVWDGYIWVFGGNGGDLGSLKSVERYDPRENTWTMMPDMKHAREGAAAVVWNDRFIISGGLDDTFERSTHRRTNTVECLDLRDGSWTELPKMPNALNSHSLVAYQRKIIAIGGDYWFDQSYNVVWELDPTARNPKWRSLVTRKYDSRKFAGIVFGNELYVIGGIQGMESKSLDRVEIFDGTKWRKGPSLPCSWYKMSAVIIPQSFADYLSRLCKIEDTDSNKCVISYGVSD